MDNELNRKSPRWYDKQSRGSISFMMAAVLLPLLFFLFALSIDITKFIREEELAQKRIDDATLFAYRFLPYQQRATEAAQNYLAQFGDGSENAEIYVDADSITIRRLAQSTPTFAQFFVPNTFFNYSVLSRARGTPFDTFIMVDSGTYLAPDVVSGTAWGSDTDWPAASFFAQEFGFMRDGLPLSPRLVTQQCFNPLFTAVKQAAISTFEYIAGFRYNSVGVGIFPGSSGNWVDTIRPMQFGDTSVIENGTQWGEASFKPFNIQFGSSELCAAAAERENSHEAYQFPLRGEHLPGLWEPPAGAPIMITPGSWNFNSDYQRFLRVSQSIWSRVVHYQAPNTDQVLTELYSRIVPVSYDERGGLVNQSRRTGIIIAADVPYASGIRFQSSSDAVATALASQMELFRQAILNNANYTVSLYFVVLEARTDPVTQADLTNRLDEFESFLANQALVQGNTNPQFELKLIRSTTPEQLTRTVAAHLVLEKKSAVLSR